MIARTQFLTRCFRIAIGLTTVWRAPGERLNMMSRTLAVSALILFGLLAGCAQMPTQESDTFADITQLTTGFEKAGAAQYSADMRWVIFQGVPRGESEYQVYISPIHSANHRDYSPLALGRPIRITPAGSRNSNPSISPDGKSILFASTAGKAMPETESAPVTAQWDFPANLELFRADDWHGAMETAEPNARFDFAKHALTDNAAYDAECAYSPDGKWIVFASNRDARSKASPEVDLYVMRTDGTNPVRLTYTAGYDGGPTFSPDGRRIAYRSDRAGNGLLQVFVADLVFDQTGEITGIENELQLTNGKDMNWGPGFHPSGQYIVYASSAVSHQNHELFITRVDGKRACRITFTNGLDGLPTFSPDGDYLMWTSKRTADGTTQLFGARVNLPGYLKRSD